MSLAKQYIMRCDAPRCGAYLLGPEAYTGRSGSASNESRRRARANGWRRVKVVEHGTWIDLCSFHARGGTP